ncbi:hypothetical protein [Sphingomonas cavernae]|uniref:Uncharacterized protein n=1 Tax=Sphingomonas cavernae TaxID=2320861 RepID=A0A418WMC9_9SPHN|nr:hypothetical protein [Sphingomonas cavernae]RJF91151.1 hypothetical protein D3876_13550 [Sphingomonas cavernae]
MRYPNRFRLMLFGRPLAPWRDSKAEAQQDALDQCLASRDAWSRTIYLTVPAWIDEAVAP